MRKVAGQIGEKTRRSTGQRVGLAKQPQPVLQKQILNWRAKQVGIFRGQPPINEEISLGVDGNHTLDTIRAPQRDPAVRQINFRARQIEF